MDGNEPFGRPSCACCGSGAGGVVSSARAALFEADPMTVEEPPHGADPDRDAALPQHGLQFLQGHIRRLRNLVQQEFAMDLDPVPTPVPVLPLGANVSALVPRLDPTDRARCADTKTHRRLSARRPRQHRFYNTHTKVVRSASCRPTGQTATIRLYFIIALGISRMIAGKEIRIATLMMSTKTNQPQPLKMSPMETCGATPLRT